MSNILKRCNNVYINKASKEDLLLIPIHKFYELIKKYELAPSQIDEITYQLYKVVDNIRLNVEDMQDIVRQMTK